MGFDWGILMIGGQFLLYSYNHTIVEILGRYFDIAIAHVEISILNNPKRLKTRRERYIIKNQYIRQRTATDY